LDRPGKTKYFLDIALSVAARSTCLRRKFGAVIVKGDNIVGTGYNGNARGVINCYEVGCIKDMKGLPANKAYDLCPAVHAEENAIINSSRSDRIGARLYIAGLNPDGGYTRADPCQRCKRKIINSEISEVILLDEDDKPVRIDVKDFAQEDTAWYVKEINKARKA
jgi:dCMP deaminase